MSSQIFLTLFQSWAFLEQISAGGRGSIWPSPFQISAPKGPIAAKFYMDVKTHVKSMAMQIFLPKTVYLIHTQ